ncbi:MAG: T9SS type B sorting domain-containing protein [Bacteroidetes bacterium]|nr:MAG: T9SS type B sorting domain-containing protein [Bacteroidota bacterium]
MLKLQDSFRIFAMSAMLFCSSILMKGQGYFVPNEGQWDGDFIYRSVMGNTTFFLDDTHMAFTMLEEGEPEDESEHSHIHYVGGHHYRIQFLNAQSPSITTVGETSHTLNYFLGKRGRWRSGLRGHDEVILNDLYPDVDLKVYFKHGQLKYDLLSDDAENLSHVKFFYEGVEDLRVVEGRLHMSTSVGEVIEARPYAYHPNTRKPIQARFEVRGDTVSFIVDEEYNGPIVLDPIFIFSSYTGSFQDNWGYSATYHPLDSTVYGVGVGLGSGVYPITPGALDSSFAGDNDVTISRFSSDGSTLIYSTYLGGGSSEQPSSCIADDQGRLYVMGTTGSFDFPCTSNAIDSTFNSGTPISVNNFSYSAGSDLFVSVLSADGTSLEGSTYLGGSANDGLNVVQNNLGDRMRGEIILGNSGSILVSSTTFSTDIPLANAFQTSIGGMQDGWMIEMDNQCENLLWSTYFGGAQHDVTFAVRMNLAGKVYTCGATNSAGLPGSANGFHPVSQGGRDGFITVFDATTRVPLATTYNGTSRADYNFLIDLNDDGDVYVFGQCDTTYPYTPGAIHELNSSVFIHQFDSTLAVSKRSLCFGNGLPNNTAIAPTAFAVDHCGDVYLSGWGGSLNGISPSTTTGMYVTPDAYKDSTDGNDLYFAVIDASFTKFNYATFFGANDNSAREHVDGGTSRFDPNGVMYQAICAGCGGRSNYPTFPANVVSRVNHSSNCNLAVTVIAFDQQQAQVQASVPDTVCSPFQLVLNESVSGADWLIWDFGGGDIDTSFTVPNRTYSTPGTYSLTIIALDTNCNTADTAIIEFEVVNPSVDASFGIAYDRCDTSMTVTVNPLQGSGSTYYWDFGDGNRDTTSQTTSHSYRNPGTYTITVVATSSNCFGAVNDTSYQEVTFVTPMPQPRIEFSYDGCAGNGVARIYAVGAGWQLYNWTLSDGQTFSGPFVETNVDEGQLTITLSATDTICNRTVTVTETVDVVELSASFEGAVPNVFTPDGDGLNDFFKLRPGVNGSSLTQFTIKVYDRWGQLLFESSDIDFAWDGKYNGRGLTEGVYFWVISSSSYCGSGVEQNGTVHILKSEE